MFLCVPLKKWSTWWFVLLVVLLGKLALWHSLTPHGLCWTMLCWAGTADKGCALKALKGLPGQALEGASIALQGACYRGESSVEHWALKGSLPSSET